MVNFRYQAISDRGKQETGFLDAENEEHAQDILIQRNLVPLNLSVSKTHAQTPWWARDIVAFGALVKSQEIAGFFQTLASMLEARLPIESILKYAAKNTRAKPLRAALENVIRDVQNGKTLADAMNASPHIFDPRYVTILKIGERSNNLMSAATQCAKMLHREQELRSEVKSALIYPAVLLAMSMVVIGIVLFHLVPTLAPVFSQAGAELPTSMRTMLTIRSLIITFWPLILVGMVFTTFIGAALIKSRPRFIENLLISLPFVGRVVRDYESQRFSNIMFLMLESGASLPEALSMVASATSWRQYKELFNETLSTINSGGTLFENLNNSTLISPILKNMLSIGEKTDRLIPLLKNTADMLQKSHRETLQTTIKMLTPALTLLIGLGVGIMIFSTMTVIMDINDVVF